MALSPQQWGDVYKQYQAATTDNGVAKGYDPEGSFAAQPNFKNWATANLSPDMASQVTSELGPYSDPWVASNKGYGNFPAMFKSSGGSVLGDVFSGIGNIGKVLAPAALMTMGIPALAGEPGLGSAIAANYAGAGAGATGAAGGAAPAAGAVESAASGYSAPSLEQAIAQAQAAPVISAGDYAGGAGLSTSGLGLGAAGALGLASPTGAPATPGLTAAAPATPAGAAPAVSAGGGAAPAAAPGAAAATGGGAGVQAGGSVVDNILGQLKKNALSLGLMGASLAGAGAVGQKPMPGQETLTGLGNVSADVVKQYLTAAQSGNLTAPQQATLDQYTQQAKNQVRQYFESIGQGSSSARMQAEQQVDQTALAMKQQLLQQTLASGLQALGAATGPLNTVAQYQLGQDKNLQEALGRFATGAGLLAGTNAGGQTAEAAKTVAATTP